MKKSHDVKSGEWAKHLRKFGKKMAARKSRINGVKQVKAFSDAEVLSDWSYCGNVAEYDSK